MVAVMWLLQSECAVCGVSANGLCRRCSENLIPPSVPPLLAIDRAMVLCSYEGTGADLLQALKFQNRRQALGPIAEALAPGLADDIDAIVPVPPDPERLRERGYHVPALLAKQLSRRTGAPVVSPLERVVAQQQTGKSRAERQSVQFTTMRMVPERVVLVDDVVTTGATAVACAVALGLAGARHITLAAIAATPSPERSRLPVG